MHMMLTVPSPFSLVSRTFWRAAVSAGADAKVNVQAGTAAFGNNVASAAARIIQQAQELKTPTRPSAGTMMRLPYALRARVWAYRVLIGLAGIAGFWFYSVGRQASAQAGI